MNKKIILGLVAAIVILLGVIGWMATGLRERVAIRVLPEDRPEVKVGEAGYGWSTKDTVKEAVKEAVSSMKAGLGGKAPKYVLLFFTVNYDKQEIHRELRRLLGPDVQIQGSSSTIGVMSPDGFHVGKVGSLAMLGVASYSIDIGVGGADLDVLSPREAGRKAIETAIKNVKREGAPQFVYITAAPGVEEEVLPGIEEVIGIDVPIIGGSSGDNDLTGKWGEIANDQIYNNGVTLAAIYTNLEIGRDHEFGYMKSINQGIATKVEGRVLYEIDNRLAGEVYNEWTGGHFNKELNEGGSILAESTFYPLARIVEGKETSYICVAHPGFINLPEKSVTLFANIDQGDRVLLLHGNWEWLVNRAQSTARKAMLSKNISKGEGVCALYTFCAGRLMAIPEAERSKIPLLLKGELGNIPFVGGFTLGEQVFMPGIGNRHANLVNSLAIFKK